MVSRIEMQEYAQASAELLAIQIDAAINPGMASICCSLGATVINVDTALLIRQEIVEGQLLILAMK